MADQNNLLPGGWRDEKSRQYKILMLGMLRLHREGQAEQAESLAEEYLMQVDLPILFRCHCHMILGVRHDAFAVYHAERAVYLLDRARDRVTPEQFPQSVYAAAQTVLAETKADEEEDIREHNAREAESDAVAQDVDSEQEEEDAEAEEEEEEEEEKEEEENKKE